MNCFEDASETTDGYRSLTGVKLTENTGNSVSVEFSIPETSPYFDGHFPESPILPALAQVEICVRFAAQYLGTGIDVSEIKRIKFSSRVHPGRTHILRLEKSENNLSFKILSEGRGEAGEIVCSSGTLVLSGDRGNGA